MHRPEMGRPGICFEDVGKGAPPIVLIHNRDGDHPSLVPQVEHFRRGHRVVAVDLRSSDGSQGADAGTSISALADDIAWLIFDLGIYAPVVVGHGLGGMVAIEMAARHADLPSAVIALHPVGPCQPDASLGNQGAEWNSAAALAACSVPVLYVVAREGAGSFIRLNNPEHVNALIDAFLARHGKDERASGTPAGRLEGLRKSSSRVRNLQRLL